MRARLILSVSALLLAGCGRAPESKEAVRQGVMQHLAANSGLDIASMDVEVTSVSFSGNEANAAVNFRPKASPDQGMQMNYTMEKKGAQWIVKRKADSGGGPHGSQGGMPPDHPPVPKTGTR